MSLSSLKKEIIELLNKNEVAKAEELAKEAGLSSFEWESILTDHYWDWNTED